MGATDEELLEWLEKARKGDERSLARLLEHLRPRIEAYLRDRVRSNPTAGALAEELTQDTLLRAASSIDECRAETSAQLSAWARTIARRTSIDWYRKREQELARRAWTEPAEVPAAVLRSTVIDDPGGTIPEDGGRVDRALGRLLMEAQSELSAGTQEVIRRRLLYGDTWSEAGQTIGTTAGGAKRRWQRAQKRLRREVRKRAGRLPPDLRRAVLRRLGASPR